MHPFEPGCCRSSKWPSAALCRDPGLRLRHRCAFHMCIELRHNVSRFALFRGGLTWRTSVAQAFLPEYFQGHPSMTPRQRSKLFCKPAYLSSSRPVFVPNNALRAGLSSSRSPCVLHGPFNCPLSHPPSSLLHRTHCCSCCHAAACILYL